jgi:hypothetical protein
MAALLAAAALPAPARAGGDDPWTTMLERLPSTPEHRRLLVMADFVLARDSLDLPDPAGSADERLRAISRLTLDAGLGVPELLRRDTTGELGFGLADVDRTAETGAGPAAITLLVGGFRRSKIERAAEDDEVWSDELQRTQHAGTEYLSWDGEGVDPERITDARPLGQGGRLAVDPPFLWWTTHTRPMRQALEATAGDRRSLADDPDFARLAEEMAGLDAYGVLMSDEQIDADPLGRLAAAQTDVVGLEPYRALATGVTRDDDGPVLLVALVHADATAAETNAERLHAVVEEGTSLRTDAPWSELLEVEDITAEGNVVTARLRTEDPSLWFEIVVARDSLLATGGAGA